jgi:hypothetical protein
MAENAAFPLSDVKLQVSEDWVVADAVALEPVFLAQITGIREKYRGE